uniref:phosphoglycolate phosphatase n=1 Tax=mine drainage metagenome TaxID=410659 RepID=E6PJJ9_9ZZZZ
MFDLVMFDLDGTLVQTAPEIADAVNDLLREQGLPEVGEDLIATWIGHGTRELMTQAYAHAAQIGIGTLRRTGTMDRLMPRFTEFYEQRCGTRSRLYPQVLETLRALRQAEVRMAVVTNKEQRFTTTVLMVHQIRPFFDMVIAGDTLAAKKPDPLPVRYCLDALKVPAARVLFVGDSQIDVDTAHAAGVPIWAVPYGYNLGHPIAQANPDRIIPTIAVVAEAIAAGAPQSCAA